MLKFIKPSLFLVTILLLSNFQNVFSNTKVATTIWEQLDDENTGNGTIAQDFEIAQDTKDCEIAVDFVLSEEVTIKRFKVKGYYQNSSFEEFSFNVKFYNNSTAFPSETVIPGKETSTTVSRPDQDGIFAINFDTPITLPAGTYWAGFQIVMNSSTSTAENGFFTHRNTNGISTPAYWRNPGDGLGTGNTNFTSVGSDLCFALYDDVGYSGLVAGNWEKANSPFNVDGDIQIPDGFTLTIEPGVEVNYKGYYKFDVQGRLLAEGLLADSILFTVEDQSEGWEGIIFDNTPSSNDTSIISFTHIEYAINSANINVDNFSKLIVKNNLLMNSSGYNGGGITCDSGADILVINNKITKNYGYSGGGIDIYYSSPKILGNLIYENEAGSRGGGININYNANPLIVNNTVILNSGGSTSSGYSSGIQINSLSNPILKNCIIYGNEESQVGIYSFSSAPKFYNCNIEGGFDSFIGGGSLNDFEGQYMYNIDFNPIFDISNPNHPYSLQSNSPCIDNGTNDVSGLTLSNNDLKHENRVYSGSISKIDIGAYEYQGNGSYVSTPEFSVETGIYGVAQAVAISCANSNVSIYYTFDGTIPDETSFLYTTPIGISGSKTLKARAYDNLSILNSSYISTALYRIYPNTVSGDVSGVWLESASPYCVISDIEIPNGQTLIIEPGVKVIFAGFHKLNVKGRLLAQGTVTDSIKFTTDKHEKGWRGIQFNNTFDSNEKSVIEFCQIEYGRAKDLYDGYGGGIYITSFSKIDIKNNTFENNYAFYGSALYCVQSSSPIISGNKFINNYKIDHYQAVGLAVNIGYSSNPLIENNLFANNDGAGLNFTSGSSSKVINCTFANNNGYGIGFHGATTPDVYNSIIYGNTDNVRINFADDGPDFYNCNIEGGEDDFYLANGLYLGTLYNCFDADPSFNSSSLEHPYSLLANSPMVNIGTNSITGGNLPIVDIMYNSRIFIDGTNIVDVGAYELQESADPGYVLLPIFTPEAGNYDDSVVVVITSLTLGTKIYYTLDGTEPDSSTSQLYTYPIKLFDPNTIKAIAYELNRTGLNPSLINSAEYNVVADGVASDVSGVWNLSGSPYNITGDITIPDGETLEVRPGVQVIFTGHYKLDVKGRLLAIGKNNADSIITFKASNTDVGWRGIRFDETTSSNDTSKVTYATIKNGNTTHGGAFYIKNFSKVIIEKDSIIENNTTGAGAGIYISSASPIIKENIIAYNVSGSQGGGIFCAGSSSKIFNNNISFNTAFYGAGIKFTYSASDSVFQNNISNNIGPGLEIVDGSTPLIQRNSILTNNGASRSGGIYIENSTPEIINNLIATNIGQVGAAISCNWSSSPNIYGNTIALNSGNIGGIYCGVDCSPNITNTILYGNGGTEIYLGYNDSEPWIIYSNVPGGKEGIEGSGASTYPSSKYVYNIDVNPRFLGTKDIPFGLSPNSPCINAGTIDPRSLGIPLLDLAGQSRINRTEAYVHIIDIGGYEFQGKANVSFSGAITDSSRWVADIIDIAGNVVVDTQDSLEIVAGVHINFGEGKNLVIKDSLTAIGTPDNQIVIDTNDGSLILDNDSRTPKVAKISNLNFINSAAKKRKEKEFILDKKRKIDTELVRDVSKNSIIKARANTTALDIKNYDEVTIESSKFEDGGVVMAGSSGRLSNNTLGFAAGRNKGGSKVGIKITDCNSVEIINNEISNPDSGIVMAGSTGRLSNNTLGFAAGRNKGGSKVGIKITDCNSVEIINNEISNPDSGIVMTGSTGRLSNNTLGFAAGRNKSTFSTGILLNNTTIDSILFNTISNASIGIEIVEGAGDINTINNIFWKYNNTGTQIEDSGNRLILKNNDISGVGTYNGGQNSNNINSNPFFIDTSNHDYHLNSLSPCIDAGLDIGYTFNSSAPDIGAYEFENFYEVFIEDFENGLVKWTFDDRDSDGYNWFIDEDSLIPENNSIFSEAIENSDNIIISPAIDISGNGVFTKLKFKISSLSETKSTMQYRILISTTGTSFTDFTEIYNGNASDTWQDIELDLSGYAGNSIYFAFRHIFVGSSEESYLKIDDVIIEKDITGASGIIIEELLPKTTELFQNYPNPFNPSTTIKYNLSKDGFVSLKIYNSNGQIIRNLVNSNKIAGKYKLIWDGKNDSGKSITSGLYFYRLKTDKFNRSLKAVVVK